MRINHLYTPVENNRHYRYTVKLLKNTFGESIYSVYNSPSQFISKLDSSVEQYDIILITAHGNEDSIIVPRPEKQRAEKYYRKVIRLEQADSFKNNLVVTFACYTAQEFGPELVNKGAQAYLGFHKEIGGLIAVRNIHIAKQVRYYSQIVLKKILSETIVDSIYDFITKFQTVEVFRQNFSFKLEKRIIQVMDMNLDALNSRYDVHIRPEDWKKWRAELIAYQLDVLGDVLSSMECLGDKGFIPYIGFDIVDSLSEEQKDRLEHCIFNDKKYEKEFISKLKAFEQKSDL